MGLQPEGDEALLEQRGPGRDGLVAHADVRAELCGVHELARMGGAEAEEALEGGEVTDIRQQAQITLARKEPWHRPYYWAAFVVQGGF
jgi:hypothetical protein